MDESSCSAGKSYLAEDEAEPPGSAGSASSSSSSPLCATVATPTAAAPPKRNVKIRMKIGPRAEAFRRHFFPDVSAEQWCDWRWQLRNRLRTVEALSRVVDLSAEERAALFNPARTLPFAITPYYASLISPSDPRQAIRRCMVPVIAETVFSPGEEEDPLHEEAQSPAPGLVHRYPDRVLFLATGFCAAYCRYCTRSRLVGGHGGKAVVHPRRWEAAIAYIEATPQVRDVLISGGDPLTMTDELLDWLLRRLRRIPHVEVLRLGTKVPMVLPQRITPALCRMLRRYHPLWMSIHATHPDELTPEAEEACNRLADAGIPLGSQTVLLAGVNDDVATMRRLMCGLMRMRVRPYYLYQCDPIKGSAHFRAPVQKGMEIIQGLRGYVSGYAVPSFIIDAPGGGGKVQILPENVVGRENGDWLLRNYEGKIFRYPEQVATPCS
ncbi:MAG: KamA family radical SAM protein [Planctomycetota bacterium]|nr:KamA family radical SAM protein [Planctomycetota bacterium]